MLYNMLYMLVHNRRVKDMKQMLCKICYRRSNRRLYKRRGPCYVAICLLYNKKNMSLLYSTFQPSSLFQMFLWHCFKFQFWRQHCIT